MIQKCSVSSFAVLTACLLAQGAVAAEEEWEFSLEPYLLLSSIEGDSGIGRVQGAEVDVDFGDILEVLEIGAMVHFEALRNDEWGVAFDYGFMDLGSDISGPRGGVVDADVRQGVLELLVFRRLQRGENHIDLFGGVRWWDNDIDVVISPAILPGTTTVDIEEDWVDPIMGARWWHPVSESWEIMLRGDIGGFGISSDFTAAASFSAIYEIKENMSLELAYKATWVDYEDGNRGTPGYFAYDTVTHGPMIGVAFKF